MLNGFTIRVRAILLVTVLAFAAQTATAQPIATEQPQTTARTTRNKESAEATDRDSLDGLLIIVGIVGVVIFLAWACSRVGDNRSAL